MIIDESAEFTEDQYNYILDRIKKMPKKTEYQILNPDPKIVVNDVLRNGLVSKDTMMHITADSVSDGYHTMDELYQHRHALFCALCKIYDNYITPLNTRVSCWKSKQHADGTMFANWFIAGMTIAKVDGTTYITYHLPMVWWNNFNIIEVDKAPEWDGHTSFDVIQRLLEL